MEEEDGVRNSGKPEEEVVRKPERKKKEVQTNRQGLTVGLGKGKIKGRKSTISDKNVLELRGNLRDLDRRWQLFQSGGINTGVLLCCHQSLVRHHSAVTSLELLIHQTIISPRYDEAIFGKYMFNALHILV